MATLKKGAVAPKLVQTANASLAVDPATPGLAGAVVFLKENGVNVGNIIKDGIVYGDDYLTSAISGTVKIGGVDKSVTYPKGTLVKDVIKDILLGNNANIPVKSTQVFDTTQGKAQHTINAETKSALAALKTSLGSALHYRGTAYVPFVDDSWYNTFAEGIEVRLGSTKLLRALKLAHTAETSGTIAKAGHTAFKVEVVIGVQEPYPYCESLEMVHKANNGGRVYVIDITSQVTKVAGSITFNPNALESWLRGSAHNGFNPGTSGEILVGAFIVDNLYLVRLPAPSIADGNFGALEKGDVFNCACSFVHDGVIYPAGTNVAITKSVASGTALNVTNVDPLGGTTQGMVSKEELANKGYMTEPEVEGSIESALRDYRPLTEAQKMKLELLADDAVTSDLLKINILDMVNSSTANDTLTKLYNIFVTLILKNSPVPLKTDNVIVNATYYFTTDKLTFYFIYNGKHYSFEISETSFKWLAKGIDTASGQFINTDISTIDNLWLGTANVGTIFGEGEYTVGYALYKSGRKRRCGILYVMVDHTATFCTQVLLTNNEFNEQAQTLDMNTAVLGDFNILTRWRKVDGTGTWSKWQWANAGAIKRLSDNCTALSERIVELENTSKWYTLE